MLALDTEESVKFSAVKAFVRDAASGDFDFDSRTDPSPMLRLVADLIARRRADLASRELLSPTP